MELSKEEYIKLKQKEYYINNYKKNNIKKKVIKKFYNDVNDDKMKNIYNSACSRIRETIKKYNLNIKLSYNDMLGCDRTEFKQYIINKLLEGMTLDNFGEWEMDHIIPISRFNFETIGKTSQYILLSIYSLKIDLNNLKLVICGEHN